MNCRRGFLFFSAVLVLPSTAFPGAWTQKRGASYHKFSFNYFLSNKGFNASGNRIPADRFTDFNFTYYLEWGLRDRLTLLGSLPLKRLESQTASGTFSRFGFGDIDLGLRVSLAKNPVAASFSLLTKFPYLYSKSANPAPGNSQEDLEARFLLARGLGEFGYAGIEAGYRFRAGDPSDEFRYLLEYGLSAGKRIYLRTKLDGIKGLKNASGQTGGGHNPTLAMDFDIGKWEATAGVALNKNWSLEATNTYLAYGRNTSAGNNVQIALLFTKPLRPRARKRASESPRQNQPATVRGPVDPPGMHKLNP